MNETERVYHRATARIPGGTQLLSKRPEQFCPGAWPAYYRRAGGVEVEDLDGRTFVDVSIHGIGACPLGYADPDVDKAVVEAIRAGGMCTLNCPEELELAERLCDLHPWAEMARYARSGGEAMAMAVRIARAATGRDVVAVSGYHGWHDWYLAANLDDPGALDHHLLPGVSAVGVPPSLAGTTVPFPAGDASTLDALATHHADRLAAIVLEPARGGMPADGFLDRVVAIGRRVGAVVVFDEITSAMRMNVGGIHQRLGVAPDLAVFAKGLSNGYPMAAVIGRRAAMEHATRSFISSTYWSERIGPVAALATLAKYETRDVPRHLVAVGERMRDGWRRLGETHGLDLAVGGLPPLSSFAFRSPDGPAMMTLYTSRMLAEGFLASGAFYASYAHQPAHIDAALDAADRAFARVRAARDAGRLVEGLKGVAQTHPVRRDP